MRKIIYICEKPSQARDIARNVQANSRNDGYFEGNDSIVTWCLGHMLELAPPDDYCDNLKPWRMAVLPVVPKVWKLTPKKATKKQFTVIKNLLKKSNEVVIATDADREGEVIGREVLDYCEYKGAIKRLWLSALDDESIQKALSKIREGSFTQGLYQAGLGRSRADWLIGMNLTMATSHLYSKKGEGVLSVGRVQTPTLNLVVERDRQVEHFIQKDYFTLTATFLNNQEAFKVKWEPKEEYTDEEGRCLNKDEAQRVAQRIKQKDGEVMSFSNDIKKQRAPLCFSLSALQKLASSQLGLSAKNTLEVAQSLYEKHKATTYPRTDCQYLPVSQFNEAETILKVIVKNNALLEEIVSRCNTSYQSAIWNDKKITAHHAIIPTANKNIRLQDMSETERSVYEIICKYYLAQFMGDYVFWQRKAEIQCEGEVFKASTQLPKEHAWKQAISTKEESKEEGEHDEDTSCLLPMLERGALLPSVSSEVESKKTKPLPRFTEGALITAMKSIARYVNDESLKKTLKETAGIGTEATRANIIELLLKRGYLIKKGKSLLSAERGRNLIDLLPSIIKDPATTAQWEQMLDEVSEGKAGLDDFLFDQVDVLETMLKSLSAH